MRLSRSGCPIIIQLEADFTGLAHVSYFRSPYRDFTIDVEKLRTGAFECPEDCYFTEQELRIATSIVASSFASYLLQESFGNTTIY